MSRGKEGKKNRLRYDKDVGAIRQNIYNNLNVKGFGGKCTVRWIILGVSWKL